MNIKYFHDYSRNEEDVAVVAAYNDESSCDDSVKPFLDNVNFP